MPTSNDRSPRKQWMKVRALLKRIISRKSPGNFVSVRKPSTLAVDIPVEILQEIFIACVSLEITPSRNREILRICQVSSVWRKAAIGTLELWSALSISFPHFPPKGRSSQKATATFWQGVGTWLERSGASSDLSLTIQDTPPPRCLLRSGCVSCLNLVETVLIPYAQRVYHLRGLTPHTLEEVSHQPLPSLQSLILVRGWTFPSSSFPLVRRLAPNLRRLGLDSMWGTIFAAPERSIMISYFNQLTHLTTGVGDDKMFTQIFSAFPNLEAMVLYFTGSSSNFAPQSTEVFLPKLLTLTIVLVCESFGICLFSALKMPALQTFRLRSPYQIQFDLLPGQFLTPISRIRALSLISSSLVSSSRNLGVFFSNLPDIEELDIQDCTDHEDLFARLSCISRFHLPSLCHLRTLRLDIHHWEELELEDSYFVGFIRLHIALEPLFRVLVYVSGNSRAVNGHMARIAEEANLPIDIIVWDEKFDSRADRWKYRMEGERGIWDGDS